MKTKWLIKTSRDSLHRFTGLVSYIDRRAQYDSRTNHFFLGLKKRYDHVISEFRCRPDMKPIIMIVADGRKILYDGWNPSWSGFEQSRGWDCAPTSMDYVIDFNLEERLYAPQMIGLMNQFNCDIKPRKLPLNKIHSAPVPLP